MFMLKASDTFDWPIKARVPDGGKHKTVTFTGTFKILSSAEITDLNGDGTDPDGAVKVLQAALVSFSGLDVEDDHGDLVTDHEERKQILFRYPFMVNAASEAFAAGISGRIAKN